MNQSSLTTRLGEYISLVLPDAHGHQQKAVADFVLALISARSCCQAALARFFDNFEAASRRLTGLLHNSRLSPDESARACPRPDRAAACARGGAPRARLDDGRDATSAGRQPPRRRTGAATLLALVSGDGVERADELVRARVRARPLSRTVWRRGALPLHPDGGSLVRRCGFARSVGRNGRLLRDSHQVELQSAS